MTKDVLISISGMHTSAIDKRDLTDEPIEVITPASYFCKNGKHYIIYDEVAEGLQGATKNKIKISGNDTIEIMKSGLANTHMVFEPGKKHLTNYNTPYGWLTMGIYTKDIEILEEEELIYAKINYNLDINEEAVAEAGIRISITPASAGVVI